MYHMRGGGNKRQGVKGSASRLPTWRAGCNRCSHFTHSMASTQPTARTSSLKRQPSCTPLKWSFLRWSHGRLPYMNVGTEETPKYIKLTGSGKLWGHHVRLRFILSTGKHLFY